VGSVLGFVVDILDPGPSPGPQAGSRLLDAAQKTLVRFEALIKPVVLGGKADQHPAGFPRRVITMSSPSASLKNRGRSLSISESETLLILDFRTPRAPPRELKPAAGAA
jgi:hypothetical protein